MSGDVYPDPTATTVIDVITSGITAADVVTIHATCEVEYEGRAAGYLGTGDRVVLCKPDGTLLVHRPSGNDPVNWQPPGSTITANKIDGDPVVTARRSSPDELVRVYLRDVALIARFDADDTAPLELEGTEADMHEYILDHPDEVEPGLRVLEHERDTPYGTIDVYANDEDGCPVVIEVKRRQATLNHVDQLKRYMELYRESNPEARGILVAPAASEKVQRALRDADLEFAAIDEFAQGNTNVSSTTFDDFRES